VAGSRVYVIYDEFVNKAVEAAQNWKVGDPFDASNNMGPQVFIYLSFILLDRHVLPGPWIDFFPGPAARAP
jgi:hypothetical protein